MEYSSRFTAGAITFFFSLSVAAQSSSLPPAASQVQDLEVEALYDQFDQDETVTTKKKPKRKKRRKRPPKIDSLSELATLAPFSDIAVIQRRFLPKTGRFEINLAGLTSVNNPFFNNLGASFRGSYYFQEKYGVELQYLWLSSSQSSVTENLEKNQSVRTTSLTTPKSYLGAAFKWNPIYGKLTLGNKRILPFDMFFTLGGGITNTDEGNGEASLHIGTGQIFAMTKSLAFTWNFTWNFYQAESSDNSGNTVSNNQDDLFLSFGLSFFVPEASYR